MTARNRLPAFPSERTRTTLAAVESCGEDGMTTRIWETFPQHKFCLSHGYVREEGGVVFLTPLGIKTRYLAAEEQRG